MSVSAVEGGDRTAGTPKAAGPPVSAVAHVHHRFVRDLSYRKRPAGEDTGDWRLHTHQSSRTFVPRVKGAYSAL